IRCGPAATERGNQRDGVESPSRGESDEQIVRSAALSSRARQLTPQAGERERLRLRPKGMAPARRGWQSAAPAAVVVMSLSLCAGVAFAGGGGITPPSPPKVNDVVCISTCGGIHKATADSKVQVSGRHLRHVTRVLFNADGGGRIAARPIAVARRAVKVRVPQGSASGKPKVTD